jgi:hypothetical protein
MSQASSIIDTAIGFIPGIGKPKRAKSAAGAQAQLEVLQKSLAKLARDVEKLSRLIANGQQRAKAASGRSASKKRTAKASSRRARPSRTG